VSDRAATQVTTSNEEAAAAEMELMLNALARRTREDTEQATTIRHASIRPSRPLRASRGA
jgi:hypothetical protein